jgi:short-subunit dehydrogenase
MNKTKKTALITGASEGIGRSFALKLAQRGYQLTLVARNDLRLDSLLAELEGHGHSKIIADLSTRSGLDSIVNKLTDGERYSLLVNNAGFGAVGEFDSIPLDRTREMISLNISALVELTYAFLQRAERGDGIIQVSSVLSFLPMPASAVYAATKAFVTSFSEGLWFSCRRKGIVIVNLCPGNTITKFAERAGWGKSEVPSWASQTAEAVSEKGIRAFERKSGPTIVSGSINHFVVFLTRIFSREMIVMITGRARKDPLNPKG